MIYLVFSYSLHIGAFDLGGIGTATLAAIVLNLFLNRGEDAISSVSANAENAVTPVVHH